MHPVIAVVGPTGSGKSDLGLRIASNFRGEIIGCDSIQVYCGLDVGSAKIAVAERQGIPHHLIDVISPAEELTAGAYARLASATLLEIAARGSLPVVVGGTGLYLRALFDGLSPAPDRDEALRQRLGRKYEAKPVLLPRFLRRYDPLSAARIHSNDRHKLIRAVELTIKGRQAASVTQERPRRALPGVRVLKIGLSPDRKVLYDRLNRRSEGMFSGGLLQETVDLLGGGVQANSKPMQSLGYKQAVAYLSGSMSYSEAVEQCQIKTRQYAKRQLTWFRRESNVEWLEGFGTDGEVQERALQLCSEFLGIF